MSIKGSDESSNTPVMVFDWGGCEVSLLCSFALVVLLSLALLLCLCFAPLPPTVHGGPLCQGKYAFSPLTIQCDVSGMVTLVQVSMVTPLICTLACSLPALLSIATYPPF